MTQWQMEFRFLPSYVNTKKTYKKLLSNIFFRFDQMVMIFVNDENFRTQNLQNSSALSVEIKIERVEFIVITIANHGYYSMTLL